MAIYVPETDETLIMFQQYPPKSNEGINKLGNDGDDVLRLYISRSKDKGESWSEMEDITNQIKLPLVSSQASGPGVAIQVKLGKHKGRILIPFNAVGGKERWYNFLVYSDDFGKTWGVIDGKSQYGTNESQIVEVGENQFIINARSHRFDGTDSIAPEGWRPWDFGKVTRARGFIPVTITGTNGSFGETHIRYDLIDPLCQGGTIRYSGLDDNQPSIL